MSLLDHESYITVCSSPAFGYSSNEPVGGRKHTEEYQIQTVFLENYRARNFPDKNGGNFRVGSVPSVSLSKDSQKF